MTDFQKIADSMSALTCICSIEKLENGRYGAIRIVAGNAAYIDSIEHPAPGLGVPPKKFIPNQEYTTYLARDLNFEDFCYRSAVEKKCLHAYAHPERMEVWLNMSFMPLAPEDGNICYCIYMMEINLKPSAEHMSEISGDIAARVLEICIRLRGTENFEETMQEVIKDIRDLCDAGHCCILTIDEAEKSCGVLCEAFAPDSDLIPVERYLNDSFFPIADSWKDTIAGSNCLIVKNEQDMEVVKERNPAWYASLAAGGAKTIVLFPLKSRDQLLGYIWAINFNAENTVMIKEALELTTFILGSELGSHLLLDRLRILSSKDMLTGVFNRNEMNNYVDSLCTGKNETDASVGVIFADLNGLKTVNDEFGHNAGDVLLKDAANALREVFANEEIFRAGGDEFCLIITDTTEEELAGRIAEIRRVERKYNRVSFSLGGSVVSDSRNVRTALRQADERMYEDKEKFYRENPDAKKR